MDLRMRVQYAGQRPAGWHPSFLHGMRRGLPCWGSPAQGIDSAIAGGWGVVVPRQVARPFPGLVLLQQVPPRSRQPLRLCSAVSA